MADLCLESPRVMSKLVNFLSSLLDRVAESNDANAAHKISVFHGLSRPNISIESYLDRILKYANCSPCCFIVAYIYLDRFTQRQPALPINSLNVHRLLITSVMVAAKFMDDLYYNNAYYAKVGGISTTEMNFLEVDFLFGLGFHLNVTPTTFYTYCTYLQREMLIQLPPLSNTLQTAEERSSNLHLCYNEDESSASHQQQQQQPQQQELAV